jgi:hypothetical protein
MSGRLLFLAPLSLGLLVVVAQTGSRAQDPAETPANRENIQAALRLTQAAAAEYEILVGDDDKPLALQREPVLKWSNPDRGEVHGNVFLWTRDGRPLAVGALFKWFSPHTHMSHEFQSFAEGPLSAKFHGKPVWKTTQPGLRFEDLPGAAAPSANEAKRLLQVKQLAKDFTGSKTEREDPRSVELRLLPQPIHRYAAPKQGIINGALFAFVQGTDPEIFLLIEARGKDVASARWQFAATRMNSVEVRLHHRDRQLWSGGVIPWKDVYDHEHAYTSFLFKEIPDFLNDALAKPKP